MKIYLAAPWVHKDYAQKTAQELRDAGLTVVSRWHDTKHASNIYEAPEDIMKTEAKKDVEDVGNADTLVYLNTAKSEGKATELGMAIVRCMKIYVVGGKENNVFLHLPQINHMGSVDEVIQCLRT